MVIAGIYDYFLSLPISYSLWQKKKKKKKIFSDAHSFLPDRVTQTSNLQIFQVQVKLKATV